MAVSESNRGGVSVALDTNLCLLWGEGVREKGKMGRGAFLRGWKETREGEICTEGEDIWADFSAEDQLYL